MRSVYIEESFEAGKEITLSAPRAHHLINVLRVKVGDEIMLLDGMGLVGEGKIFLISKKAVNIQCLKTELKSRPATQITLGIGQLKKDAMDDVLKAACELGVKSVLVLKTEYSQTYDLNLSRINKLLASGIEQSNNPILPVVESLDLSAITWNNFDSVHLFTLKVGESKSIVRNSLAGSSLILIGPEGGFGERDLEIIPKDIIEQAIQLDLPIMRAPTAFKCAVGYLQAFC